MLDVRDLIRIVWRHKIIIALVALVAVVAASYFVFTTPPQYEAETLVRVDRRSTDIGEALAALSVSQRLASTYSRIATTRAIAGKVAERLGPPHTAQSVMDSLSAQQVESLDLLRIRARDDDPEVAAQVANEAAGVLTEYVAQTSTDAQGERLLIVDPAVAPDFPAGAGPLVVLAVALASGLVLGVGFALILDYFEDRIVDNDEIEAMTGLPILGVIPIIPSAGESRT